MNATAQARLQLENELRSGFSRGELELYFQPLIDTLTGRLAGAEALLRWRSPERGLVSPGEFIPLAEDTGLIVPIGEWALLEACRQVAYWRDLSPSPLYVAVNVSTIQFGQTNLLESVTAALKEYSLPPGLLKLEITESVLLQDSEITNEVIQRITDMGVGFSIDDFGTGYSSLSYLRRYPFETLKIDRSFVSSVTENQSDADLVTSIVAMAASLNLKVVAEGIETDEQFAFVKKAGCDIAQGFGLGRPMPARAFSLFVEESFAQASQAVVAT
jgi:EAL domain-containing protein (putative c-di-GMP-specific phosphodiesterase class I)